MASIANSQITLWTASEAAENHGDEWGWPDIYYEGYIHKFQPEHTHRIH